MTLTEVLLKCHSIGRPVAGLKVWAQDAWWVFESNFILVLLGGSIKMDARQAGELTPTGWIQ